MMNIDVLKMIFGMVLLLSLVGISAVIIFGHVEQHDSMALMPIVTALATLSGSFATWAFQHYPTDGKAPK